MTGHNKYAIGIDIGGTKIKIIAFCPGADERLRARVPTTQGDYEATLDTVSALVREARCKLGCSATIGIGVILGSGVGGGLVIDSRLVVGANSICGEWGHNPLPSPRADDLPAPLCHCGRVGCIETYLSGPGLVRNQHGDSSGVRGGCLALGRRPSCNFRTRTMSVTENLTIGLTGAAQLVVGEQHTAPHVGSGKVRVLATPVMVNLIEAAALAAAERFLPAGHQSLGTHLDVRHIAATPVGMRVSARAELVKIDGRNLIFRVTAEDERELIGDGTHMRVVVNVARFDQRAQAKAEGAS